MHGFIMHMLHRCVIVSTLQVLLLGPWTEATRSAISPKPHIVFVLADDYGYNDVGYHGSDIRTPVLDELCSEGVRLENYYVQPTCTPTRSQFMSGRYQIRTGLQHGTIWPDQANALPRDTPSIADKMREAGYATHMVGKWHLGHHKTKYLPIHRGFDTFYGFYTGSTSYYTHARPWIRYGPDHIDLHDQDRPVTNETGHYSTHLFTAKAVERITSHDLSKPLFMYLSYQAVHTPLEVPEMYVRPYQHFGSKTRVKYAGMVSAMDEGIGNLTRALKDAGMWDNTVLVFSTDNGGALDGGGNNYPLRGSKGELFEGAIRAVGFVHAPALNTSGTTSRALMHVSDWYPTFVQLGGGSVDHVPLDGFNQWDAIRTGTDSPRKEILHAIDPLTPPVGEQLYSGTFDTRVHAAIRSGDWKLITGNPGAGGLNPGAGGSNPKVGAWNEAPSNSRSFVMQMRPESTDGHNKNLWLFNIVDDPRELKDLSSQRPYKVRELLDKLFLYNKTAVRPRYPPRPDPRSNPAFLGGVWGPWADEGYVTPAFHIPPITEFRQKDFVNRGRPHSRPRFARRRPKSARGRQFIISCLYVTFYFLLLVAIILLIFVGKRCLQYLFVMYCPYENDCIQAVTSII